MEKQFWPSGIARQDSCNCYFIFVSGGTNEGSHQFIPDGSEGLLREDVRWGTNTFISPFQRPSLEVRRAVRHWLRPFW